MSTENSSPAETSDSIAGRRAEVLTFAGCPNAQPAVDLVTRIINERGDDVDVVRIDVHDAAEAEALCFLGSPSIRIDGLDVEPGAAERTDYAYGCRVYRTPQGLSGLPSEGWIRTLLEDPSQSSDSRC